MMWRFQVVALQLPGWSPDIERSFKEILFRFLEEVHCTKAALYLLSPDGEYLLATQYGFGRRDLVNVQYPPSTALPVRALKLAGRVEAMNQPENNPEIYEILKGAGSRRMLLVPLPDGDRLLGFVDARDKGRKQAFDQTDEESATRIAQDLLQLIQMTGIVDVSSESRSLLPDSGHSTVRPSHRLRPALSSSGDLLDSLGLWQLGRTLRAEMMGAEELGIAVLSILEGRKVSCRVLAAGKLENDDMSPILQHQFELLQSAGRDCQPTGDWKVRRDEVDAATPHRPLILGSRILLEKTGWVLLLSLMASAESGSIPNCMSRIEAVVQEVVSGSWCRYSRRQHAKGILQPEGRNFDLLIRHSMAVSELGWSLAHRMGLGYEFAEGAAIAGLLHDVGMQAIDYEKLYRHPSPGEAEVKVYRSHATEGEIIAEKRGFGDLASMIRSHHERWDGGGYPDRLQGTSIPLLSRILHVAEVFDTLVSSASYRSPISPTAALATIEAAAGTQFDPVVVQALREHL